MKKRNLSFSTKAPLPWKTVILLTITFFLFTTLFGIWIVNKKINPTLMIFAKSRTKNIATLIINEAIKKEITNQDLDNILVKNNGDNTKLEFNTRKVNELTSQLTTAIQNNLHQVENGELTKIKENSGLTVNKSQNGDLQFSAPLGIITNNVFLADKGPSIPINLRAIGDIETDIESKITPYGINSAFIEITATAKVEVRTILPFLSEATTITSHVPIAMGTFEGEVPNFYNGLFPVQE